MDTRRPKEYPTSWSEDLASALYFSSNSRNSNDFNRLKTLSKNSEASFLVETTKYLERPATLVRLKETKILTTGVNVPPLIDFFVSVL
ncbi:hypothetical protein T265_11943 [Opisthorchis viverrini]|uniref:Uncharacterized protein n=1 Tax=Opisthorchis viverrini TaxID=6198 RepID=A0A074Z7M2_OPIVI|nr:hypothetical protein T265_11943 [Opisthorchis viverrini]KER19205.1 hypothetical protein T265_11943 [Opisthorchis viverrini]